MARYITLLRILPLVLLTACGGGGGSDGGDNSDSLDKSTEYDTETALLGSSGESRNFSGDGSDAAGDQWTSDWTRTRLSSPDSSDPCESDETQVDSSLTLTEESGNVVNSAGPNCYTIGSIIQETFSLDESVSPDIYFVLTTGGTFPATAQLGDGGNAGVWNRFEDSNGDGAYDGSSGSDTYTGSLTTNWKLEAQNGKAALVLSSTIRDSSGVQTSSETDTYFIEPDGTVTGFKVNLVFSDGGELSLSGNVN